MSISTGMCVCVFFHEMFSDFLLIFCCLYIMYLIIFFNRLRASEIKHSRVAMVATVGFGANQLGLHCKSTFLKNKGLFKILSF